jgi:nucleotide-binding universal stress UspA family protein
MNVSTILVPTDFSEDAARALQTAIELAKKFDARIEVVHSYHVDMPIASPLGGGFVLPEGFLEGVRAHAEGQVAKVVSEVSGQGLTVEGQAIEGSPSQVIVAMAKQCAADLIVMGTRGLTGLKHVALGSVAERTIRTAPCPVLTVKADEN